MPLALHDTVGSGQGNDDTKPDATHCLNEVGVLVDILDPEIQLKNPRSQARDCQEVLGTGSQMYKAGTGDSHDTVGHSERSRV